MQPNTPIAIRYSLMKKLDLSAQEAKAWMEKFPDLDESALYLKYVEEAKEQALGRALFEAETAGHIETVAKLNQKLVEASSCPQLIFEYERISGQAHIIGHSSSDEKDIFSCPFHKFGTIFRMIEESRLSGNPLTLKAISDQMQKDYMKHGFG